MGIIVGSETRVECDASGCRVHSTPHYDQREARAIAERDGWRISPFTGKALCPECHRKATRLLLQMWRNV